MRRLLLSLLLLTPAATPSAASGAPRIPATWPNRTVELGVRDDELARFDVETSRLERTLVHLRPQGMEFVTVKDVYAAPGEFDVMAHVHGMRRIARYGSWTREPFTAHSRRHITVYEL